MNYAFYILLLLITIGLLSSCDPDLNGELRVFNESNEIITVTASSDGNSTILTFIIAPGKSEAIRALDGTGNQKAFDCCPCEYSNISIETVNGAITKDPLNSDNWLISNQDEQKKFGGPDLRCEFRVSESDI